MITQGIFSYIRKYVLIIVFVLCAPQFARAQIVINEIAWMGTSESANAEWIELYNNSDKSVVLDGWVIHAHDGNPKINLVGSIGPDEYYLLERTSDESVPTVLADSIYSGSLSNTGERLQLIDAKGVMVDDLDFSSSGWPAGDNTTKATMQRNGDSWITAAATPGAKNNSPQEPSDSDADAQPSISTSSSSAVSAGDSAVIKKEQVTLIAPDPKYSAKLDIPDYAVVGVPFVIKALVKQDNKKDLVSGRFDWYLGDGGAHRYYKNTSFEYQFTYPGEYTIVLEYYSNSMKDEIDSIHQKKIVIIPDSVSISGLTQNGGVSITNTSTRDIDLKGWSIATNNFSFIFPKYTIVKKGGVFTLPITVHRIENVSNHAPVKLINPAGQVVSVFEYGMLTP